MNTTTSPQVGKGTLKDAGILEENEDDNDNARYRQSMPESMKTGGTGNIADVNSPCQLVCVCARGGGRGGHTWSTDSYAGYRQAMPESMKIGGTGNNARYRSMPESMNTGGSGNNA